MSSAPTPNPKPGLSSPSTHVQDRKNRGKKSEESSKPVGKSPMDRGQGTLLSASTRPGDSTASKTSITGETNPFAMPISSSNSSGGISFVKQSGNPSKDFPQFTSATGTHPLKVKANTFEPPNASEQPGTAMNFYGFGTCIIDKQLLDNLPGFLYDDMVELTVDDKKFFVHRGLLIHLSHSFAEHLPRRSVAGQVASISLQDDTTLEVVEVFRDWLYTHRLCRSERNSTSQRLSVALLCDVYLFGKDWQIPLLENAAIDALIDTCRVDRTYPDLKTAAHVYSNTTTTCGSALRRLLVDITVESKPARSLSDNSDQQVIEDAASFLLDVTVAAMQATFTAPHPLISHYVQCLYHNHSKSETMSDTPNRSL